MHSKKSIQKTKALNINNAKTKKIIISICLVIFVACVFCVTNLSRVIASNRINLDLFWSYREFFKGNMRMGAMIILNIALFAPVGFMIAALSEKHKIIKALIGGLIITIAVESSQYIFHIGLFELDDIFNNTLGAVIGGAFCSFLEPRLPKAVLILSVLAAAVGLIYVIMNPREETKLHEFSIQIDEVKDGKISGFCFAHDGRQRDEMQLILSDTATSKYYYLDTEYGIPRPDVNDYFKCENDFTNCGFTADFSELEGKITADMLRTSQENEFAEYHMHVKFGSGSMENTDEYLTAKLNDEGGIVWIQEGATAISESVLDVQGTDLEDIIENGKLCVARVDQHCWVYQYDGYLYWIADDGFTFSPDGKTLIQYTLWTTQNEKLPQGGPDGSLSYEDRSDYFENHEITNKADCGRYRVCRRKLPTEYAITDIRTGYAVNGRWAWKEYFMPCWEIK